MYQKKDLSVSLFSDLECGLSVSYKNSVESNDISLHVDARAQIFEGDLNGHEARAQTFEHKFCSHLIGQKYIFLYINTQKCCL